MNAAEAIVSWMEVAEGMNGKNGKLEGKGRVKITG